MCAHTHTNLLICSKIVEFVLPCDTPISEITDVKYKGIFDLVINIIIYVSNFIAKYDNNTAQIIVCFVK